MLINISVIVIALVVGISAGLSFVYIDKFNSYLKKKGEAKILYKIVSTLMCWSLIIIFPAIVFMLPMVISTQVVEKYFIIDRYSASSIYIYVFTSTFFITLFFLVKTGRLWNRQGGQNQD
jgi:hypothetical protein